MGKEADVNELILEFCYWCRSFPLGLLSLNIARLSSQIFGLVLLKWQRQKFNDSYVRNAD